VEAAEVTHTAEVQAPARVLYDLVADVTRWPVMFQPTVHVEHQHRALGSERFAIWALVNGAVASWVSQRTLEPDRLRIGFLQEHASPPIVSMSGAWEFRDRPSAGAQIALRHRFRTDGSPGAEDNVRRALDGNTARELAALRRIAEIGCPAGELVFSFEDTIEAAGPAEAAYSFVADAQHWPERLPHVSDVSLTEDPPGIQRLAMTTLTADGASHATESVRVCRPARQIAYKQTTTPALLLGHSGIWLFEDRHEGGSAITARHVVMLDWSSVPGALGPRATLASAREHVREALGGNSRITLAHAKRFAERA